MADVEVTPLAKDRSIVREAPSREDLPARARRDRDAEGVGVVKIWWQCE